MPFLALLHFLVLFDIIEATSFWTARWQDWTGQHFCKLQAFETCAQNLIPYGEGMGLPSQCCNIARIALMPPTNILGDGIHSGILLVWFQLSSQAMFRRSCWGITDWDPGHWSVITHKPCLIPCVVQNLHRTACEFIWSFGVLHVHCADGTQLLLLGTNQC